MLWWFLAIEPCAKSRTELTLFDTTRMIEAHSIGQMFIHLLQPLKSARQQRLVPMNRRPRTDNQLEFADSLQCFKHLSPEWIYLARAPSLWIDRINNLADDKLIEVDDLLEMRRVQAHHLRVQPKAIWRHRNGRIIAPRVTAQVISHRADS